MSRKMRSLLSLSMVSVMVVSLAFTGCSKDEGNSSVASSGGDTSSSTTTGDSTAEADTTADDIIKPDKITMMVNGTVVTKENGRDAFQAEWERLTGIELEIIQPDHDAYFDVLGQTFASGDWPDVVLLSSTYYSSYAEEGVLWDMTDAWENSEVKASGRIKDEALVEALRVNDRLYGISPGRGGGCITYVKKSWLDNVGMEPPTNYEEYLAMLDAFTNGDPNGTGKNDTYGVAAAGFMGPEAPYINYLPEFYQDAYPSFYVNDDGVWVDGFTEPAMVGALERLRFAYEQGYIDKETLTNGTSDCRNKFYEDQYGVFTYWAGTWGTNLKVNLEANGLDGELIALEPIEEVGHYIERQTGAWSITSKAENPEGIFKYFFETMLDGGEVQQLWTYGVEGVHWSTAAEEVCGNVYEEGEFHMLESLERPGTQYTKNHIDPMESIANFTAFEDPGINTVAPEARVSMETFGNNSTPEEFVPSTDAMSQYNGDLITLKREIVANVVVQGASIESEMARFKAEGGAQWSQMIVDELNGN